MKTIIFLLFWLGFTQVNCQSLSELTLAMDTLYGSSAMDLGHLGLKLVENESSDSLKAEFYLRVAIVHGISGDSDSSLFYFDRSLQYALDKQHYLKSRAFNGIGNVNRQTGDLEPSLESFQRALRVLENKVDKDSRMYIGSIIGNIAGIYFVMDDMDKALEYTSRGLKHATSLEDLDQMAYNQVRLALIYSRQNKFDLALEAHETASKLIERENITYLRGYNLINLGKVYDQRGEEYKALDIYRSLLDHADIEIRNTALENSSKIFLKQGDFKKCIEVSQQLFSLASEAGTLPVMSSCSQNLYKAYQGLEDYKKANEYLNRYLILNDSLINIESLDQINQLEAKYENEKKEQEIVQLKLENQQAVNQRNLYLFLVGITFIAVIFLIVSIRYKSKTNLIISNSLEEKETLLREIHHRVKNNLQVISSLLSLQSRYIEDSAAQAAVNEGQNRVKSMALIHQKLYQKDNLAGVEALDYIENLANNIRSTYGADSDRVSVKYDVSSLMLDVDTIIPLGLILNELISNSFKHAFPGDRMGELNISLREENQKLTLLVKDNGVGTKNEVRKSDSFGMRLIQSLSRKLEAEVSFNFKQGAESCLIISKYKLV